MLIYRSCRTSARYARVLALICWMAASTVLAHHSAVENYERILLPATRTNITGAFGSLWMNEIWVRNGSLQFVDFFPEPTCEGTCSVHAFIDPLLIFEAHNYHFNRTAGRFLYVERLYADDVQFNVRSYDASRASGDFGVEIPVIRERDFRTGEVSLMNIPTQVSFRQTLRVYHFDAAAAQVRLQVLPLDPTIEHTPLIDETLTLIPSNDNPGVFGAFILYPTMIEIGWLADRYPEIRAHERVRVLLTPVTAGMRYWAYVTVVHNETQRPTLVTPE